MNKYCVIVFLLFYAEGIYAQIGINTTSPRATLDITGKNGVTDIDGVLFPRLTRAELTAKGDELYGADQNGVLLFITDVTGGDILSQRANIDASGYYYFDGPSNLWKKTSISPWKVAGSTTQATLNTQDIYQNGNVGIGDYSATVATEKLDVNGNVRISNMQDGTARSNYPYTIVSKADGTLAALRGNYEVWRGVSTNAQAIMSDDDGILNIFSSNVTTITLPTNPNLGRVVTIRIDGANNNHVGTPYTYNIATPGVTPIGYLPTNYDARNRPVMASDYLTTIKPKTAVTLAWTGPFGGGGLGWVQIGGDSQLTP